MKHLRPVILFCLFTLSCKKPAVEPTPLLEVGHQLKKVIIHSNYDPTLTTINFTYLSDGKVKSAHKVSENSDGSQKILDYEYGYALGKITSIDITGNAYSLSETFKYSSGVLTHYTMFQSDSGKLQQYYEFKKENGIDLYRSHRSDSIVLERTNPNACTLTYFKEKTPSDGMTKGEMLTYDQNKFTYQTIISSPNTEIVGSYSNLDNPFQKEVWETFGPTIGSKLLSLVSGDTLTDHLILGYENIGIPDAGKHKYEYILDHTGRLINIDFHLTDGYKLQDVPDYFRYYNLYY